MGRLVVFAIAGLLAQLVDGALGMGFGVTCGTILLANGIAPAVSSASVHLAKIGTTLTSGASHWRFGNVSWPLVARLALPGAVGAYAGATVLSSLAFDGLGVVVAAVLLGLGVLVIARSLRGQVRGGTRPPHAVRTRLLVPLGLGAGFVDAVGGGGWGPVTTPTLLTAAKVEPRMAIGSVSAAELFVSLAATAGFVVHLGEQGIRASFVVALMLGGVVAAPVAAWLTRRLDATVLGVVVGTLLLLINARVLMLEAATPGPVRLVTLAGVSAVGSALGWRVARRPRPVPAGVDAVDMVDALVDVGGEVVDLGAGGAGEHRAAAPVSQAASGLLADHA
jgi:uncharacterized membrane protein YfcA